MEVREPSEEFIVMFWAVFLSLVGLGLLALVGQVVKRVVGGNKLQRRRRTLMLLVGFVLTITGLGKWGPGFADDLVQPAEPSAWQMSIPTKREIQSYISLIHLTYWTELWEEGRFSGSDLKRFAAGTLEEAGDALKVLGEDLSADTILGAFSNKFVEYKDRKEVHQDLQRAFGIVLNTDQSIEMTLYPEAHAGVFVIDDKRAIMFFRGTSDPEDYIDDTNVTWAHWGPSERGAIIFGGFLEHIHRGGVGDKLVEIAKNLPTTVTDLIICGHSLGAAASVLLTAAVSEALPMRFQTTVILVGAPRAGNAAFVKILAEQKNVRIWRVVNHNDPITRIAWWTPRPAFYRHPFSTTLWINRKEAILIPAGIVNHATPAWNVFTAMGRYVLFGEEAGGDLTRHMISGKHGYDIGLEKNKWVETLSSGNVKLKQPKAIQDDSGDGEF